MASRILAACCIIAVSAVNDAAKESAQNGTTRDSCLMQMDRRSTRLDRQTLWMAMNSTAAACRRGSNCVVPAGENWVLDESLDVETLTIQGTLSWDVSKDDLEIRAGYVVVENTGHLKIGTTENPMNKKATIYIKKGRTHDKLGTRVLGSVGSGKIDIHGRRLTTWTLLSKTAIAGSAQLFVKDDPEAMGWRAGDRIGIATTSRGKSSVYTIASIGPPKPEPPGCGDMPDVKKTCSANRCKVLADNMHDKTCNAYCERSGLACVAAHEEVNNDCNVLADLTCDKTWPGTSDLLCECEPKAVEPKAVENVASGVKVLHLKEPLEDEHWGGFRDVVGRRLEMAAEVVNLERTVLVTGDHEDFYDTNKGLHTISAGSGYADIRYARVEYCGQRDVMGRYCLHFHLKAKCPKCVFEGNSVIDSAQSGITIHGTHDSLVSNNIVWSARAVGIYTEDGNEMNNLIKQNVVICSWWEFCSVNWLKNVGLTAGIFLIGMTNDIIENRVAGHENCIWTPGGARGDGHQNAFGRVCPMYTPFGEIRGNVNHDCQRFGLYLDNQFPRNIKRDENGYVTDKSTCQEFTPDGADNGIQPANVVKDEFDWHNMFVGQYNLGDVQFVNYTGVNNAHNMYWKSSKNFADGRLWHLLDSTILSDPNDKWGQVQFLGPAGPFVFGVKNTVFAGGPVGCGALCAGQHCGLGGAGGPCNVEYLLENVDFSEVQGRKIEFGVHSTDPGQVLPFFVAKDDSLGGHRALVSRYLNGFGEIDGCSQLGSEWSRAYACSKPIRRLNVWGPDVGDLTLSGPGYSVSSNRRSPALGMNAGRMIYEGINGKGYGAPVLVGGKYKLRGNWAGDEVVIFSDDVLGKYFGTPNEEVSMEVNGKQCTLRASDDRHFLGPKGPVPRILDTHARIEGGRFACGGPPSGEDSTPSTCGELSGVLETCSADGCTVHAKSMKGKSCSSYCESGGLFCVAVWKTAGDRCAMDQDVLVGCGDTLPDDEVICECSPEKDAEVVRTTVLTTTTLLPPDGETMTAPPSGTKSPTVQACAALPDVKKTCSDDGCKVLAGGMTDLTCREYCARSGLECGGAWEEVANDCNVKETMTCGQVWPGTSDLICECATTLAKPTVAPGAPPSQPDDQPVGSAECNLEDVKEFCSANGCRVLAGAMTGKTCDQYCARNNLFCIGAWEEVDNTCAVLETMTCSQVWPGTSDLVCECSTEETARPLPVAPSPEPSEADDGASAECDLRDVKRTCSASGCRVLAGGMTGSTCDEYCTGHNLICLGAWEEVANDCNIKETMTCGQVWPGTSDLICECGARREVAPSQALQPPPPPPQPQPQAQAQGRRARAANVYEPSPRVGGWGGWCTCPDGQRYNVGDRNDGCANGPQSLACSGGTPGECVRQVDAAREGMQVTCAAANVYERSPLVGGWGGWCTCPDGQRYNVGDRNDGCANGPQSLACSGGTPGECIRQVDAAREGMQVTCAPA